MQAFVTCNLCDVDIAIIRQSGNDRGRLVLAYMLGQDFFAAGIKFEGLDIVQSVSIGNRRSGARFRVNQLHLVVAAFGEQTRN